MLKHEIKDLLTDIKQRQGYIDHNEKLIDIYEGNLAPYVEAELGKQLSEKSLEGAIGRIPPINILTKLVDKLSRIYQENPVRSVPDGSDSDAELLKWYEQCFKINATMNQSNEFFNMSKSTLIEPYLYKGKPKLRAVPNDRFIVWSNDVFNPMEVTHVVILHSSTNVVDGRGREHNERIYIAYTDEEVLVFDQDGKLRPDKQIELNFNEEGVNPYGKIPFVYVNKSANFLMPIHDTDLLRMTLLIPLMLADLNVSAMYQCFSIIFGIDIDAGDLVMAPNSFWSFNSDPASDKKPELGTIKPEVSIEEVLGLIQSELAFWLNSKGIKAASVGTISPDNAMSGIAKIIDEMDIAEDRKKQVDYFTGAEEDLWELVFSYMHPYWALTNQVENLAQMPEGVKVVTDFAEQLPLMSRGQLVADLKLEVEAGFTSTQRAIAKLNPKMDDAQIEELEQEIADDNKVGVDAFMTTPQQEQSDEN